MQSGGFIIIEISVAGCNIHFGFYSYNDTERWGSPLNGIAVVLVVIFPCLDIENY